MSPGPNPSLRSPTPMVGRRYHDLFTALRGRGDGAFIPFLTLGDPDLATSAALLDAAVAAGADGLEVGLPFSDPVADGPVIQAAAARALAAGTTRADCWRLIDGVRRAHPELPIGLLVYANLVVRPGLEAFYGAAADAGADSVLVADVPTDEVEPFWASALSVRIAPVLIVPPNADHHRLARIAKLGRGYTYVTARSGVTGDDGRSDPDLRARLTAINAAGGPPAVLGFGIATPTAVEAGLRAGAAGTIAGSAVVRQVAAHLGDVGTMLAAVRGIVSDMKAATRGVHGIASEPASQDL